jgi:nicotinamide-nucleotide amidase
VHRDPRAYLLSIGSELLVGETVDTNAAFLAGDLARLGMPLLGVRQLPDDQAVIASALSEARRDVDLVIVTGGLGPTHDDITREGLADALGEPLSPDPQLAAELEARFAAYGPMPASNLRQTLRIPSAEILANPIGSAPGWWVDRDGTVVALLPGVPSEMRRMWADEVAPRLGVRFEVSPLVVRTVKTFGIGESAVAEIVGSLLDDPGDGVTAGIYARDDGVHLRFSGRDLAAVAAPADRAAELLRADVWGTDGVQLAGVALRALGRQGVETLASWEADTGGSLLAILAAAESTPGAARFTGGLLDAGGAASAPVADALLQLSLLPQDARGRSRVQVALAGSISLPQSEVRIHGSGPQRLRRAAYAALDQVRRRLS